MRVSTAVALCAASAACRGQGTLDSYIEQQMSTGHIPGISAAVVKNDQLVWSNAYGSTKPGDSKAPAVTNSTAFMFASLSKTNIAVALMMLQERGWLSVDDDANKYLPFSLRNPSFKSTPITIHDLATHTASISDNEYDNIPIYMDGDPTITLHDFLYGYLAPGGKWSNKQSWHKYAPGKKFDYSNIGACAAAYIVEIVAQNHSFAKDFDDLVRTQIYAPLGIDIAKGGVGYFVRDFPTLAPPAGAYPSQYTGTGWNNCEQFSVPDYPTCDWRSSAVDYAKMFGMFINGGTYQGTQLLKAETVAYMKKKSGFSDDGESVSNVFWLYESDLVPGYAEVLGHDGSDEGISTYAYFNPKTGTGYVLLTNGDLDQKGNLDKAALAIGGRLMKTFDTASEGGSVAVSGRAEQFTAARLHRRQGQRGVGARVGGDPGNNHAKGCKDI